MIRTTYYIVVEERKLVLKSAFCPLFKSSYRYEDIKHIEYSGNSRSPGIVIVKKSGMRNSYPLECMWKKDYPLLTEMLQAKGLECKGYDYRIGKDVISSKNIENIDKNHQAIEFNKGLFRTMYFWLATYLGGGCIYCYYALLIDGRTHPNQQAITFCCITIFTLLALMLAILMLNYVVIEKEKLIIKNAFCSLFGSSFRYDNIVYIEYVSEMHFSGFTIYQKDGTHKFYRLECVRDKDFHPIIEMLQAKGVKFKMDNYLWEKYQKYLYKNHKL